MVVLHDFNLKRVTQPPLTQAMCHLKCYTLCVEGSAGGVARRVPLEGNPGPAPLIGSLEQIAASLSHFPHL